MFTESEDRKTGNVAHELGRIARLLTEVGPDITTIARRLDVHRETVRYRVKKKILKKGIDLQAMVDCEALGLVRIVVETRLGDLFSPFAQQLFYALSELSYLTNYQLAIPDDFWMLHFAVPREFRTEFKDFIIKLKELGIFKSVNFFEFDWFRNVPMRTEHYDFESHRWDFDWRSFPNYPQRFQNPSRKSRRFDGTDLLILKELEIDANRTLRQIRDALASKRNGDLKYKTVVWHYQAHILRKGLIKGYAIRWLGTGYDAEVDKVGQRQHRYVVVNLVVRDVTSSEKLMLMGLMNHLPFLWAEMAGKDYAAQCAFPLEAINEAMTYLRKAVHPVNERAKVFVEDQTNSVSFTIPYKSWNIVDKRWRFEKEYLLSRFENLILKLRNGDIA